MIVGFMQREVTLLWQDFINWRDRVARQWRGVGDLFAGRHTDERAQIVRYARITAVLVIAFGVLYLAGAVIPVGFDWTCCFSTGQLGSFFVPWMLPVVRLFNPQSIFAVTVLALIVRMWRNQERPWCKVAVFATIVDALMGLYTLKQVTLFGVTYTSSFAGMNCYHSLGDYLDRYPAVSAPLPPPANVKVQTNPVKVTGIDNFSTMLYLKRHQTFWDIGPVHYVARHCRSAAVARCVQHCHFRCYLVAASRRAQTDTLWPGDAAAGSRHPGVVGGF